MLGILRGLIPIALVAGLARISVAQDVFSQLSRPIVIGILGIFHVAATDKGNEISVGRLEIPWTGDCSGLNFLVLLLAVAIWLNRHEPFGLAHWARILAMIPAAVIANVLRVFTLIAYRELFFPAIETPQLHYFFGLFWLIPFALIAMPRSSRQLTGRLFELTHVAAVVALFAPQTSAPGGLGLTMAVVISLSQCRMMEKISKGRIIAMLIWLLAAAVIAVTGMESFWLPWLIVCPVICDPKWLFSIPGGLITIATHPLFALLPGAQIITWATIGYVVWERFIRSQPAPPSDGDLHAHWTWRERAILFAVSCFFLLPFLSSVIFPGEKESWVIPQCAMTERIPENGFVVTLPGQTKQIGLLWYNPSGTHRHHTLQVCLKFRGVEIEPVADNPDVFTDDSHWFREFYLQDGKLIPSHLQYTFSTLGPGKAPGVHLIYVADNLTMSAEKFNETAQKMANDLYEMIIAEKKAHPQSVSLH
jgi:exosortase/archaeosortase family protein